VESLEQLRHGVSLEHINLMEIVSTIRKDRRGMVQRDCQYLFAYKVLCDTIREKYGNLDAVTEFNRKSKKSKLYCSGIIARSFESESISDNEDNTNSTRRCSLSLPVSPQIDERRERFMKVITCTP